MTLQEASKDRKNNLNFIRFIAAVMVVFAHAFPVSLGENSFYPLGYLTKGQMSLGGLAVCIFFFFSGFFLNRSVNKGKGAYEFFKARCIRIFPCLWTVVFTCTFVLGACITQCRFEEYFTSVQTYEYLLNSIFVLRHNLPGVFEHNIYNTTVNGSLWTLPVEVMCYIGCYIAWRFGLLKDKIMKYTVPVLGVGFIVMNVLLENTLLQSALRPCGMFYCGMLFDTYRQQIHIKLKYVFICVGGLILFTYLGLLDVGVFLFLPYVLSYIAFGTKRKLSWFGEKFEISYGMYLCAWPVQQTVVWKWGGSMNPITNFVVSMPIILITGVILNSLIDKPIIRKYRNK